MRSCCVVIVVVILLFVVVIVVFVDLRNLSLKFGQDQVSNS